MEFSIEQAAYFSQQIGVPYGAVDYVALSEAMSEAWPHSHGDPLFAVDLALRQLAEDHARANPAKMPYEITRAPEWETEPRRFAGYGHWLRVTDPQTRRAAGQAYAFRLGKTDKVPAERMRGYGLWVPLDAPGTGLTKDSRVHFVVYSFARPLDPQSPEEHDGWYATPADGTNLYYGPADGSGKGAAKFGDKERGVLADLVAMYRQLYRAWWRGLSPQDRARVRALYRAEAARMAEDKKKTEKRRTKRGAR